MTKPTVEVFEIKHDEPNFEKHYSDFQGIITNQYGNKNNYQFSVKEAQERIKTNTLRLFLVHENGTPVACGALNKQGAVWELEKAVTLPKHRGNGYQQKLHEARIAAANGEQVLGYCRAVEPATMHNAFKYFSKTPGGVHFLGFTPFGYLTTKREFALTLTGNAPHLNDLQGTLTSLEHKFIGKLIPGNWKVAKRAKAREIRITNPYFSKEYAQVHCNATSDLEKGITIASAIQKAKDTGLQHMSVTVPLTEEHLPVRLALGQAGFIPTQIFEDGTGVNYSKIILPVELEKVNLPDSLTHYKPHLQRIKRAFEKQVKELEKKEREE